MTINKSNLLAGLGAGIVIGGLTLGAVSVSAQQDAGTSPSLQERLATELNVSQEDVEGVFEAHKAEKKEAFAAEKAEYLQSKVDDGTITAEQLAEIEAWIAEQQAEREEAKEDRLSKEEFQALSEEEQEALKAEKEAARDERKAEAEAFFEGLGIEKEDLFEDFEGKRGFKRGGGRF